MVRIPAEYQEVEWIESSRGEYIELPFGFDPTDEIELRGAITQNSGDKYMIAPKVWNNDNNRFSMLGIIGGVGFVFAFGNQGTPNNRLTPAIPYDANFHTITYANKVFTFVDAGSVADMSDATFGSTTANLRLFYGYNSATRGKIVSYHHKKADGTEVNFIPCYRKSDNEIGMYDTVTGQFYTNQGTGTFLKGNDVTYDPISLLETRRRILLNTPHIESASGSIATFNTDLSTNLTEMKIHFQPVQAGTGDPSPDNVRPITGWDGLTVTRCGKNWIDQNFLRDASNYKNGGSYGYYYTDWMYLPPNTKFKFTWYDDSHISGGNLYVTNASQYIVNNGSHRQYSAFTTNSEGMIRFGANKGPYTTIQDFLTAIFDNGHLQLEKGDGTDSYEPYTAVEIPISFGRTIYGGYVDLVKGEVVEEYGTEVLNGSEVWGTQAENDTYYIKFLHGLSGGVLTGSLNSGGLSNYIKTATSNEEPKKTGNLCCRFGWGDRSLYILNAPIGLNGVTDLTSFKSYLSENNLVVVYPLATPNTYILTPQTIKALKGINNIWSDANGDVEVKFWKH